MNEANGIDNNFFNLNGENELTALSEVGKSDAGTSFDSALSSSLSTELELLDGLAENIERLDLTETESNSELELFGGTVSADDSFTGDVRVLEDSDAGYTPPENLNESIFTSSDYTIIAEGKVKFRGRSDLDGETLIAEDDALVYAGGGLEIKGQPILPVQRDAAGNALLNDDNQQLLVPGAVNVGESAAESKIPPSLISRYSGLEQPQIVGTQTVEVPDYEALVESQYDLAVGEESEVAILPANTRLNNLRRWSDNFPAPGTPENPTVVMVKRNGLSIPSGVDLANYVIIVERGNVKFNGGEHSLNNVTIIAEQGKIELNRVNSTDSSFLAAKSIKVKNRSVFGGESLIANAQGKIEINSYSLRQLAASNLKVVAASDLQIKSTSEFNGELITGGDFIAQGPMSIYGSVAAKGDVLLVGRVKVFAVAEDTPEVETPVATVEEVTVTEASGIARVTISLDTASAEAVSVDYALKDDTAVAGEDYQAASGTIVFNPGETSKTIEIELIDDGIYEADETLLVELNNPNGVILDHDSVAVTITNDDSLPQLAINSVVVTEDSGTVANFEATLSEPSGVTVTVDFMAEAGTATEGDDFTTVSGTLTFEPGETSKTIAAIPIIEDSLDEIDEMFTVKLSNPSNAEVATGSGTVTIEDNDDPPELSVGDVTVTEGDESNTSATFEVTLSQASGQEITVDYATEDGSSEDGESAIASADYIAQNDTLAFEPGQISQTVEVEIVADKLAEAEESFSLSLSNPSNATIDDEKSTGIARIIDTDLAPLALDLNLANDTGTENSDRLTNDITVTGAVENNGGDVSLSASFGNDKIIDLRGLVREDGSFTLGIEQLRQINGAELSDGTYTLELTATNSQTEESVSSELVFTLDTTAPILELTTPLADGDHSSSGRLQGRNMEEDFASLSYSLNGVQIGAVAVDENGRFDAPLDEGGLTSGAHLLEVTATDLAGNQSTTEVSFRVGDRFITPEGTNGWGALNESTVILGEQDSYVVQTEVPVELGLETDEAGEQVGTRTISFDLDLVWDQTDNKAIEDQLLIYLVDLEDPNQILLGNGETGTAVFSIAGEETDFTPGLVSFDGKTVTIDASSLTDLSEGLLVFQLLNQDEDTGSVVTINNLASTTDPEGFVNPIFPEDHNSIKAGDELNVVNLSETNNVETMIEDVSFNTATGEYKANLRIKNNGKSAIGRNSAVVFDSLPAGVNLISASGLDSDNNPYVNLRPAIRPGGLDTGGVSESVELVFTNPNLIRFGLDTTVLIGSPNTAPLFEPIGDLTLTPGQKLEIPLTATDIDGDNVTYKIQADENLPQGILDGGGTLKFNPSPDEIGSYEFRLIATDGAKETSQTVTLNVVADPVTTTRISGVIENVEQQPLAGVVIELGELTTVTNADGSFTIETDLPLTDDTLKIRGEGIEGDQVYPFIAEKLPLVLGQEVYEGYSNVIERPIYLPALDVESGQEIDPHVDVTVTTDKIPGASVFVEAGSLWTQSGEMFTGTLSITEVPPNLTPAALPENISPDMVVTIQPGEMAFNTPAPLSLPNRAGWAAGFEMNLWSINPETGDFDIVGTGKVSDDGSVVETIEGGIRNSSWHMFAGPGLVTASNFNPPPTCDECQETAAFKSEVELHTGAVIEDYDLVSYTSNSKTRGVSLTYDSLRADPRPIIKLSYDDFNLLGVGGRDLRIISDLTIEGNSIDYQVPGNDDGENSWLIPREPGAASSGDFTVSMQADLREFASGKYQYSSNNGAYVTGTLPFSSTPRAFGTSSTFEDKLLHVNSIDSAFGSGWGIDGWQEIVASEDGSLLLIDGDGSELWFDVPESEDQPYVSPPGDFSTLEKLADGTFRRTMKDLMVYDFNQNNYLTSVTDTNGNSTSYVYDGQQRLTKIVDPVGLETVFNYNNSGKVGSIIDPAQRETLLEYDADGNLIRIIDPDNSTSSWSYDSDHHLINEIDSEGNSASATYDEFGRASSATTEDGSLIRVSPTETLGLYTTEVTAADIDNDSLPDVLSLEQAKQATYADANGNVAVSNLDSSGQRISAIDGGGATGKVERNEENLIVERIDSRGNSTEYTYDEQGNVTQITEDLFSSGLVEETGAELIFKNPQYHTGEKPTSLAVGDLNNDGYLDVATANNDINHGISLLFGNEEGTLNPKKDLEINLTAAGGSSPRKIYLEDLNSDSNLDLITLGVDIGISLGNGNGTFQETTQIGSESVSKNLALGDLDGDNIIDLALASNDGRVPIYRGNGDGTFLEAETYSLEGINLGQIFTLNSGDVDGDEDIDLAVIHEFGTSQSTQVGVSILDNNGEGIFTVSNNLVEDNSLAIGEEVQSELGDLNGDGILDLVASYNKGPYRLETSILLGKVDGTFSLAEKYEFGRFVTNKFALSVGDLNLDGILDIVNTDTSDVYIREGNGDGTFSEQEPYLPFPNIKSFVLEDLNLDGNLDFLSVDGLESLSVQYGNGDSTFATESPVAVDGQNRREFPATISQPQLQDLNNDGLPDLIFKDKTTAIFNNVFTDFDTIDVAMGRGDGTFDAPFNTQSYPQRSALNDEYLSFEMKQYTLADLDADGILDLITTFRGSNLRRLTNESLLSVSKGNGDGTFDAQTIYNPGLGIFTSSSNGVKTGDVDGDGDLDLTMNYPEGLLVSFNDGNGDFSDLAVSNLEHPYTPDNSGNRNDQEFIDLDNDGDLDLLYKNQNQFLSVAINDGSGNFVNGTRLALEEGFYFSGAFRLRDLDADGNLDLIASTQNRNHTNSVSSNYISVLMNSGNGNFEQQINYQPDQISPSLTGFALEDLDGDRIIDLVLSNRNGSASVFLGSGDGTFSRETSYNLPSLPSYIDLADLDNDSDIDLVLGYTYVGSAFAAFATKLNRLNESDSGSSSSTIAQRSYTYDHTFNQLTSETDELGRQTLYDLDPNNGNILATTQVVGEVGDSDDVTTSYTYTDAGLVDTMTDPLGRVTDYVYDTRGNLIQETVAVDTPDAASVNYEYDLAGNQTAVIDENGNRTEFVYDLKNRLIRTIYAVGTPDEAVETTEYDGNGNQIATVDGLGNRTEYRYDEQDRLIKTIAPDPDGDGELTSPVSTSTYDSLGNLITTTDPLGRETRYVYDSRNRLVETILPDGTNTQSQYDTDNNLVASRDAAGESSNKIYDARGRLIRQTDALGNVTSYQYDAADQLLAIVDGNGNRTSYQYDELGRQISVTDGEGNTTYTEYDKVGNVIATVDGNKNRTDYKFDNRDRQTNVTDAEGSTTTTEYDKVGNVLSITDPVNNQTSYTYDAQNRVVLETNELGFTRTFEYDDNGNSISTTDRNGREREFIYDGLNRQVEENWLDDNGNSIRTTNSQYDAASQLVATDDPDSAYNFTYDELGRLVTVDNAGTPGVPNVVLTYNYDAESNIISVSDTINGVIGATTAYSYDELDRVDQITQSGDNVADKRVDFDYDAIGQYESISRYSDLSGTDLVAESSYTYDQANRLTNLNHSNSSTEIANYDLTYDAASRITQIVDADGTNDYSYDRRDQLTAAEHSDESNPDEIYSYDKNGNRTSSSLHGDGYVTDANNRLVSDGTYDYEYDNQGNLIRQTEIATGNVQEFTWDYLNRLVAVVDRDSAGNETQVVEFTYDMFGRRLSKTVDGEATYFVYDQDNVILDFVDREEEVVLDKRYLHGERVDQVLAQEDNTGNVHWHLADHLGSVRDLVDNSGNAVNHYVYDSFGNVVSQTGETVVSRYLYTGREWDDEIGLQFNRGRFYNPELGIFINEDPISFGGGTPNLYGYVENNPINAIDPHGTFKVELRYRGYHADIVVSDKNGMRAYWGGPERPIFGAGGNGGNLFRLFGGAGRLVFNRDRFYGKSQSQYPQFFRDGSPNIQLIYDDGTNCPDPKLEAKIVRVFERIDQADITYDVLGPNSNSAAFQAVEEVFGTRPWPKRRAPGWDMNPFTRIYLRSRPYFPWGPVFVPGPFP